MAEINRKDINQYLTFKLANEVYAINVASIKEVLGIPKITKVPRMPDYMRGIINLRGGVVPVLDLCVKFDLGETQNTPDTGIIVTEIENAREDGTRETLTIGIFSDVVQKVITIEPEEIEPPPKIGVAIDTAFIRGMGHVGENFIIILNIDKILSGTELREVQENAVTE
ncbi:MAG TPA: chemotaxis protein CheW [Treponemataceae bacterium]|nr:chemotaxis protein CheW [Treponemataceae bacterium]